MCHAVNLFFEARGEHPLGQRLVLDVVVNRVKSPLFSPSTVCDVVMQRNAFEWYNVHKEYLPKDPILWGDYVVDMYGHDKVEMSAWEDIFHMSFGHYIYREVDYSEGADYFMTLDLFERRGKVPPYKTAIVTIVGDHIFFKSCEEKSQCVTF